MKKIYRYLQNQFDFPLPDLPPDILKKSIRNRINALKLTKSSNAYLQLLSQQPNEQLQLMGEMFRQLELLHQQCQPFSSAQASAQKYRDIYHHTPVMLHSIDEQGLVTEVSDYWLEVMGYSRDEILGRPCTTFLTEEYRQYARKLFLPKLLKNRSLKNLHCQLVKKDGSIIDVLLNAAFPEDKRKNPQALVVSTDISERIQVQKQLVRQEQILQGINAANTQLVIQNTFQKAVSCALREILRACQADRAYLFENFTHPSGELYTSQKYEVTRSQIEPQVQNPALRHVSYREAGFSRWVEYLSKGIEIKGLTADFPSSEQELLHSQGILSLLVVPIMVQDQFWGFIGFDDCTYGREWTESEVELLKHTANNIGSYLTRRRTEVFQQIEHNVTKILSSSEEVSVAIKRILEEMGSHFKLKLAEYWEPDYSEEILENSISYCEPGNALLERVQKRAATFHYRPGEGIVGTAWANGQIQWLSYIDSSHQCHRAQLLLSAAIQSAIAIPVVLDQKVLGVMCLLYSEPHNFEEVILNTFGVIGKQLGQFIQRKKTEQQLKISEERLRLSLKSGSVGICDWDIPSGRVYVNREWADFLEVEPEAIQNIQDWRSYVHPDDQQKLRRISNSCLQGSQSSFRAELRIITHKGSCKWIIEQGEVVQWDKDGRPLRLISTQLDITALKIYQEEIQALNQELENRIAMRTAELQASNEELENFAYSISHDLRAPLRHINGYSRFLMKRSADILDHEARDFVEYISQAAVKLSQQIEDLLQYSRIGRKEIRREYIDMDLLVRRKFNLLRKENPGRNIELRIAPLPAIKGDSLLLNQLFYDLLSNAVKYTSKEPLAIIEIRAEENEKDVTYIIRDNGVGFDEAYKEKLFRVFKRLHGEAEFPGTGIGLANAYRIVTRHHGKIWASSRPGQGATFYVCLPRE